MTVFFIRKSADIDHIAPVVYRLASDMGRSILVLCLSPRYDIRQDYRLQFLSTLPNVRITYQFEYHAPTLWHRLLAKFLCGTTPFRDPVDEFSLWQSIVHLLGWGVTWVIMGLGFQWKYEFLLKTTYHDRWAEGLLKKANPSLLVFDWAKPYQHTVGALLKAARRLGIPTVGLPHGVDILVGELRGAYQRRTGHLPNLKEKLQFDYIVVPHEAQFEYYAKCGIQREKLRVLGSARFCKEWVFKNLEISPPLSASVQNGRANRLRVVLMDKPTANQALPVHEAIQAMANLTDVDLVVCPAPRRGDTTLSKLPIGVRISQDNSARLIEWADVVIGTVSSILLEALIQGKLLVCPIYFSGVPTVFTESGACVIVRNTNELLEVLRLAQNKNYRPYSSQIACELIERLVYAGRSDRDVLGGYSRFLRALADSTRGNGNNSVLSHYTLNQRTSTVKTSQGNL